MQEGVEFTSYEGVTNFICSSRQLHKYAIMCFCFNQTAVVQESLSSVAQG